MPRPTKINPHINRQIARINAEIDQLEAERNKPVIKDDNDVRLWGPSAESLTPEADQYLADLKLDVEALKASMEEIEEITANIVTLKSKPEAQTQSPVDLSPIEARIQRNEEQVRCMTLQQADEINFYGVLVSFEANTDEGQRWAAPFGPARYVLVLAADGTGFGFVRSEGKKVRNTEFEWDVDTVARTIWCSVPDVLNGITWK